MRVLRIRTAVLGAATLLALSTMAEGAAGGPKAASSGATQIVDVSTPTRADRARLQTLGLDLTEHGDADSLEVVLYGDADARRLRDAGFTYTVRVADLAALDERNRKADEAYAAATAASPLPSGRDSYRHLTDYEQELASLASAYPGLSRPITLPHPSLEGRPVVGIEITQNPAADDGKPVFVLLGTHHAREWPSAEMTLEFAYDLLRNYGTDARTTRLVDTVRTIVVPVVNPDGFNVSREARLGPPSRDFSAHDFEMKRKNCRDAVGTCDQQSRLIGVDPNRNYGGFWGGSGASPSALSDTYRGSAPFSEPEVQNIKELVGSRPVTALVTNHTFGNLVLRPPGVYAAGLPHEEPIMAELGARMASRNGYANLPGWGLYDTSGTTEDWTFWTAGALSYTFEMGPDQFHPPYETGVVAEYLGLPPAAGAGHGGNRAAFYDALEAAADPALHSVLTGSAPAGSRLSISKSFQTSTSPVCKDILCVSLDPPRTFDDSLSSQMVTTGSTFTWNVNPSTRPSVAGRLGRDPLAPPQATIPMVNDPSVVPDENIYFPGSGPSRIRVPYETFQFEVKDPPDADNDHLTVHIEWTDPADDWDLYVVNASNQVVAQSAVFGDADEDAVLPNPAPGTYTAYIVNYDQVRKQSFDDWRGEVHFAGPPATTTGVKEAWTFRCQAPSGATAERQVTIDRGQSIDLGAACPAG